MPNWRKVITSGSVGYLSSLTVDNTVSASAFTGDGSGLTGINVDLPDGVVSSSAQIAQDISGSSLWKLNASAVEYTDGNVGIGFTNPGQFLEVGGTISAQSISGFQLGNSNETVVGRWLTVGSGNTLQGIGTTPFIIGSETNDANTVFDNTNNRVGIGTSTPIEKLDVHGHIRVSGSIQFEKTAPPPAYSEGMLFYDSASKSLGMYNDESEVTLQIGQESWIRVYNDNGGTIPNGSLVYISGSIFNVPKINFAQANSEDTYDAIGFATHDIEVGSFGYVTTAGIVRDVDTSGYTDGDDLYLSVTDSGSFTNIRPSLPYFVTHVGHVIDVDPTAGSLFVQLKSEEADYEEVSRFADGMSFDKQDVYVVESGGTLYFEVEKLTTGGDVDFLVNGVRSTLDCTTGGGVGGRAQIALTAGADANNPTVNYIYVTDSGGVATLTASTSLPTGAFAWVGKVLVPDAVTWASSGEYLIQRYTETFSNNGRGLLSHAREKLRAIGAIYISGGTHTLTIDTGTTPDTVHLEVSAAQVYQLHKQTFPSITTGPYYFGNGINIYDSNANLSGVLEIQDGTAISNNVRYNLVIWGAVNLESGDCKLFVNVPNGVYNNDSNALDDTNNTADYSVPANMKSVAFLIARITLQYTSGGGGVFNELGVFSLLGQPPGVRGGGAGAVASTEFGDNSFRIFDNVDSSKNIAFEASGITAGNTRIMTIPDFDGTLATIAGTETLTNKTLTTPTISDFTNATHDHTDDANGGTISYVNLTAIPGGIISGSEQIKDNLPDGTISGSDQLPGFTSGSVASASYAVTASYAVGVGEVIAPVFDTFTNTTVSMLTANTAYLIPPSEMTNRESVIIYNDFSENIYIGNSSATTSSGILLLPSYNLSIDVSDGLYAVCGYDSASVNVMEMKEL